ncbi:MAG: glycosyltransferase [Dehalococcoidia bacterium]|nr:glycosyltransferase [Dehalococcoidia bacterium]
MKVLMLSKACYIAAYRRKLEELARLPGVELTLIVPPYWRMGKRKDPFEPGHDQGYRTIVRNPVFNGYHHLHYYRCLPKIIADVRPDIFHIDEEPYDFVTLSALRTAKKAKLKSLFFTWQNIDRRLPGPFGFFEDYALRHFDGAIAGNQSAAEILRRKGFKRPLAVIPQFGVDPDIFYPRGEQRVAPAPFAIGYVGRLVAEKGIFVLLEAVSLLSGSWHLDLVGSGPLEGAARQKIADLGLADRVSFVSKMPSTDMPGFLPKLDTLVLPSLTTANWKEQFGRVLIEAMACGVPVVGSDSGEIPNVIGQSGMICREGNPLDIRDQLADLMRDPAKQQYFAQSGRQRVLAHFTQRKVAEKTYSLYEQVIHLHSVV